MYFEKKELLEVAGEIDGITEKQRSMLQKADKAGRDLDDDEQNEYDRLEDRYAELRTRKNQLEANLGTTARQVRESKSKKYSNIHIQTSTDMESYSLTRAVRHLANERVDSSYEIEMSNELEERSGIKAGPGLLVPLSELVPEKREITTGGAGGNLVPQEHLDDAFIDVLRAASHVMNLGPTVLDNLEGTVHIPRKTGAAATGWISGDGQASTLTADDITFDTLSLSPKYVGVLTEYSLDISIRSAPSVEEIARQDIADSIATEVDRVAIEGGDSNEPTGINRESGINEEAYTTGADGPNWTELLSAVEKVLSQDVVIRSGGFISAVGLYSHLKSTDKLTDTGNFLMENDIIDGFSARFSSNMPAKRMLFGDWSQLVIAHWGVLRVLVNPYEHFDSGSVQIRGILPVDLGVRHAEAFTNIRESTT